MDNRSSFTQGKVGSDQKSEGSRSSSSTQPGGSGEPSSPDLLARIQAAHGQGPELNQVLAQLAQDPSFPSPSLMRFYNNSFPHGAPPHPEVQPPPASFVWNQPTNQQRYPPLYPPLQHQPPMLPPTFTDPSHNTIMPIFVPVSPDNSGGWRLATGLAPQSVQLPTSSGASASTSQSASSPSGTEVDPTDGEQTVLAEEKRRRNTAASVRFRIKKKQRTINLERSVSDLTGRAEELEKEVVDLRRENGWLKEIVMLKSTRNVAQQWQAMGQEIRTGGTAFSSDEKEHASTSSSGPSFLEKPDRPEEASSEGESETDDSKAKKKGKGKQSVSKGGRK